MPRLFAVIVGLLLLGLAGGWLQYMVLYGTVEERMGSKVAAIGNVKVAQGEKPAPQEATGLEPRVEVIDGARYDFGEMQQGSKKSHGFRIRNIGKAPLELRVAGSTCKCTIGTLTDSVLDPGEETTINLEWKALGVLDKFGQSATIATNDPNHPELLLTVTGLVRKVFLFDPDTIVLDDYSVSQPIERKVRFMSYHPEAVGIDSLSWTDAKTADRITLTSELIPADDPRLKDSPRTTAAAEITLKIAPGMPLGAFQSHVRIKTSLPEMEPLEIPVMGNGVGDVQVISGTNYDQKFRVLSLGTIKSSEGYDGRLHLSVQGEARNDVKFEVAEVIPNVLNVTVGEPKVQSKRVLFPINMNIPKGTAAVDFPGSNKENFGKIVIKTNHPHIEQIVINVRMTVTTE
ncbi:MAG: DUF1573 domain-containing protein [Pirellulales bacterium]